MKAVVIKPFLGVKDGEVYPKEIQPGEVVEGDLAVNAIQAGWAKEEGSTKAFDSAPQNKTLTKKIMSFFNNDTSED